MLLYNVHTPLTSANSQTGRSPLIGCSQPIQNIRIYHLYVARPSLPSITWECASSGEENAGSERTKYGYRKCSVISQGQRKGAYLWGSLSVYSRRWPKNLNPEFEGMVLTPSQNFTFSAPCLTIQLLQFEPTNAHSFTKVTILQHTSCYTFRSRDM
jgi:hypothetical protein